MKNLQTIDFNEDQIALIKSQLGSGLTNSELDLFLHVAKKAGLDPLSRQIYAVKRGGKMTIQTSIDGLRLIAERTGKYEGQAGPFWCGEDGEWKDVWLKSSPPAAAKVGVWKAGAKDATYAVAKFSEYNVGGNMWNKMPANQIAKCAESLALRKAFPQETNGLYSDTEMQQAEESHHKETLTALAPSEKAHAGNHLNPIPTHNFHSHKMQGNQQATNNPMELIKHAKKEPVIEAEFKEEEPTKVLTQEVKGNALGVVPMLDATIVTGGDFTIQTGKYAGVKLKDKPVEFWCEYADGIISKLDDMTTSVKLEAQKVLNAIAEYTK